MAAPPFRKTERLTLDDVAHDVGVSHQTVSRVINNHPRVLPETRSRVLAAIERLGYRPNRAARFLANQRSTLVGWLTHRSDAYGTAHMTLSLQREAQRHGYTLMIYGLEEFSIPQLKRGAEELMENAAAGVIVDVPYEVDRKEICAALAGVPFVALDIDGRGLFSTFRFDHRQGARDLTQHLIGLGHETVAGIIGEEPWRAAAKRQEGWRQALRRARLAPGPCVRSPWTAEGGYEATRHLLRNHHRAFTAIFSANDLIALGALGALQEAGVRVPEDVSVVGFDGMVEAAHFHPALTTAVVDFDVMARDSLRGLLDSLEGSDEGVAIQQVYPAALVVRHSTAPPQRRPKGGELTRRRNAAT